MTIIYILKLITLAVILIISARDDILKSRVRNAPLAAAAIAGFMLNAAGGIRPGPRVLIPNTFFARQAPDTLMPDTFFLGQAPDTLIPNTFFLRPGPRILIPNTFFFRQAPDTFIPNTFFLRQIQSVQAHDRLLLPASDIPPLMDALIGFTLPFFILIFFFCIRALGAGDIKLFMAVGSIMGARFVLLTILYAFLAGGVIAVCAALCRRSFLSGFRELGGYIYICIAHRMLFRYGAEPPESTAPVAPAEPTAPTEPTTLTEPTAPAELALSAVPTVPAANTIKFTIAIFAGAVLALYYTHFK